MKILFISHNRLGDAVLSTGLLAHLVRAYPEARLTIACGPAPAPLLRLAPNVDTVFVMEKAPLAGHWRRLWQQAVTQRWDLVVDLRASLLAWLLWSRQRKVLRPNAVSLHRVRHVAGVLNLPEPPPAPELWLRPEHEQAAGEHLPAGGPILALGPTANWGGKQWPIERFLHLARRLISPGGLLPGGRVAVFGGLNERTAAQPLLNGLPGDQLIDLIGRIDLPVVLACLARADCFIGNDSGLMHMAAAVQVPTLGLFGPSREELYAPWGDKAAFVRTDLGFDDIRNNPAYDYCCQDSWMDTLSIEKVETAVHALLTRARETAE
ncbi:MAG: glycosyltransferase family 9 protein [Alphaproteobacteria bacterium]|jgi:ADP-heptose:LPS heptosyltransferase|nr:glycosyl transferase [Rhodospirillaceae bacterium]MDP6021876.1 glycosyltransferase family 9 protein [Alphaproteobacteria bacterium]MDP6256950.1 glycosyltransferase family 9 protein [Alphaproteobacteria bacterium]MDP7054361.1 glycosyltransferase family 9 protein [Alphaproteobacteria bacterium]MDP7230876.1 glycosyltransferase family 9 protein [Alphaproteobacteria bacterium]|tara:strand:+ start:7718 stop:8683 length:966 start_codon:yes stop_codon:yes gene_type:complete